MLLPYFEIENYEEYKRKINEYRITIIFIYAEWCKPCMEFKPTLFEFIGRIFIPNTCFLVIDYDKMKLEDDFLKIFNEPYRLNLPSFYMYYLGQYDKPIISVDMRFIMPFLENKLREIDERKITETNDF